MPISQIDHSNKEQDKNTQELGRLAEIYQNLPNSPEVKKSIDRARQNGEKIPRRLEQYEKLRYFWERYNRILQNPDPEKQERWIHFLKNAIINEAVSTPEQIARSGIYEWEQNAVFEITGDITNINKSFKERKNEEIMTGQRNSFTPWVEYLLGPDALYPDYLKYWALREVRQLCTLKTEEIEDENGEVIRDKDGNTKKKRWYPKRNKKMMLPSEHTPWSNWPGF